MTTTTTAIKLTQQKLTKDYFHQHTPVVDHKIDEIHNTLSLVCLTAESQLETLPLSRIHPTTLSSKPFQRFAINNPMVIMYGIGFYEENPIDPEFKGYIPDLYGIQWDIKNTVELFSDIFDYTVLFLIRFEICLIIYVICVLVIFIVLRLCASVADH